MTNKAYLGDSVYMQASLVGVVLTTENGCGASNTIFLEPEVIAALLGVLGTVYDRDKLIEAIGVPSD